MPTLENESLKISIADAGAELSSVLDKQSGAERLWCADPAVWNRHAPILFPFVGKLIDGKYRIGGREFEMKTQHGFARDLVFDCVEQTESAVTHCLVSTEKTLKNYPYPFRLLVTHRLDAADPRLLHIEWTVENLGTEVMLFSIGGHPGFLTPPGTKKEDCLLQFPGAEALRYFNASPAGFALVEREKTLPLEDGFAPYQADVPDTWIFPDHQVGAVAIAGPDKKPYVTLSCEGFPLLAVWANPKGPFICLEPWFGRTDDAGFTGDISEKAGIQRINPGESWRAGYSIRFHAAP